MRFESFLKSLDLGRCEDQMQREALFDLAILFIVIDGVVTESENAYLQAWLADIPWSSTLSIEDFYQQSKMKCASAVADNDTDSFIAHRAKQLIDDSAKQQALKMAEEIANVDGHLDAKEQRAIDELRDLLGLG